MSNKIYSKKQNLNFKSIKKDGGTAKVKLKAKGNTRASLPEI